MTDDRTPEQYAKDMKDMSQFIETIAAALRYEMGVLHDAVTQGIEDASETTADALDRAHNHGERSR